MRRRKDPIPPGAEIYWGDRAEFAALIFLMLPMLMLVVFVTLSRPPVRTSDYWGLGLIFVMVLLLLLLFWFLLQGYTLIDGDRVETRGGFGRVTTFRLSELTGYRFGPLRHTPHIRQFTTLLLYQNGEKLAVDFLQIPGRDRLRELLRERDLQPQLLTPEERAGAFRLRKNIRVERDTLVFKGERIPLSQTEIRTQFITPALYRKGGKKLFLLNVDSIACRDLLALALERNGVAVGDALPRL